MSLTDEVITIAPSGQILTFRDERDAKRILLNKFHNQIIDGPRELAQRYTIEQLKQMVKQLRLTTHEESHYLLIKDRVLLAEKMWPFMIAMGRLTTKLAYNKETIDPDMPTHITYYTDYDPGEDPVRDLSYIKFPPQGKQIIDMLVEKLLPAGKHGIPEFVFRKWIEEIPFETRQQKWLIFNFYRKKLMVEGFLEVYNPARK